MSNSNVQSVERTLSIIEFLDDMGEQGISEMSRGLGLDRSTVHRLVSTLKNLGYVNQDPRNHKYSNSFKLFEIGNNVVRRLGLRKQAQPFMKELSEKTREAVNLAVMDGRHAVYIDKIDSPSTIKIDLSIGRKMPSYCTGLGKILLSFMEESRVIELLDSEPFIRHTEKTIPDLKSLLIQLRQIRKQGYCIDNEEYVEGLLCIAAPIRGHNCEVVAALSIAVPKFQYFGDEDRINYFVECVIDVAKRFSGELGCQL